MDLITEVKCKASFRPCAIWKDDERVSFLVRPSDARSRGTPRAYFLADVSS